MFASAGRCCACDSTLYSFGNEIGRPLCLFPGSLDRGFSDLLGFRAALALASDILEFVVREMFDSDERIARRARPDQLIELHLNGRAVAILRILDQEDHQERDDRRAGVDDQLPGVGIIENRAGDSPGDHDAGRDHECQRSPGGLGCPIGDVAEQLSSTADLGVA
jgi:hypothetical protein